MSVEFIHYFFKHLLQKGCPKFIGVCARVHNPAVCLGQVYEGSAVEGCEEHRLYAREEGRPVTYSVGVDEQLV